MMLYYQRIDGEVQQEPTMKPLLAIGLMTLVCAAPIAARADFALVRFESGYCRIWWDSAATPPGAGWIKIAAGLPDLAAATAVLNNAVALGVCH
jgi:hypothetical protein